MIKNSFLGANKKSIFFRNNMMDYNGLVILGTNNLSKLIFFNF